MQKKLVVLFMIVLLAFVGLTYRLFTISRDNGERYKKQILSQQKYDSTTIPYKRGSILDRNGSILASSEKVYNVILDAVAVQRRRNIWSRPWTPCGRSSGLIRRPGPVLHCRKR